MSSWVTIETDRGAVALNLSCVDKVEFKSDGKAHLHLSGDETRVYTLDTEATNRLRAYITDPLVSGRHVAGPTL